MSSTPAASRTLAVLGMLASSPEPLAAGHLARQLDIPRSSLYRLLETMAAHGYVLHVPETSQWALGVAAYELAWGYRRHDPLQRLARPLLGQLVDSTGHSGHLSVLHGRDVVYVLEDRAARQPSLVTEVGVRLPAEVTASGLAMLAALGEAPLAALYPDDAAVVQRSGRGPATLAELRELIARTARRGHAEERGVVTPGLCSLAMPVLDRTGHPLAAVALTIRSDDLGGDRGAELVAALRRTVLRLQARLGSPGGAPAD